MTKRAKIKYDSTKIAFLTLVCVVILSLMFIPGFRSIRHTISYLQTVSLLGFIVIGQAICVVSGGIDMSCSGIVTLTSVVASAALQNHMPLPLVFAITLLVGALVGAINATCINFLKIQPIIQTIAMGSIIEGTLLVMTNGTPPSGCGYTLKFLSKGSPLIFTNAFYFWIIFLLFFSWLMTKNKFGRYVYGIGTNENTAYISGVNIIATKYAVYIISGICCGFAGIMMLGNIGNTYLTLGTPYQLFSISSVVVGGLSIKGGHGNFIGIIAGTMMIILIRDILNVMSIPEAGRNLFQGLLIIVILLIYGREKKAR